jgi:4'-phosphopantetheinyl transferase
MWLNQSSTRIAEFTDVLSDDEISRAEKYQFKEDRDRFVAARGQLRVLLSGYIGCRPGEIRFGREAHGKPFLQDPLVQHLSFNISHSHTLALYAITTGARIGIDVEYVRRDVETEIARKFFSKNEAKQIVELPERAQADAVFNCWVRKEAFVKAHGGGISFGLGNVEVSVRADDPSLLRIANDDPSRWSLRDLYPDPDYKAAIVVEGTGPRLHCWSCL